MRFGERLGSSPAAHSQIEKMLKLETRGSSSGRLFRRIPYRVTPRRLRGGPSAAEEVTRER